MRKYKKSTNNNCRFQNSCEPLKNDTEWFAEKINKGSPPKLVQVLFLNRNSDMIVVAPHGGKIEPRTEEIAGHLANELRWSCYCFCSGHSEDERGGTGNQDEHHIESKQIWPPQLGNLLTDSEIAVSIHGCTDDYDVIQIGGHNKVKISDLANTLTKMGFKAEEGTGNLAANSSVNFINKLKRHGVQIELPFSLYRDVKKTNRQDRRDLAGSIATAIRDLKW